MAKNEERYMIVEEEKAGELIITTDGDIMDNAVYLIDGNRYRILRNGVTSLLLLEKNEENVLLKKGDDIDLSKVKNESGTSLSLLSYNCSICREPCTNCKFLCATCKTPCRNCNIQITTNCSTDTDDFEKYLESLSKKVKVQCKVKTIGVDTCDLETHFDYYKQEKKVEVIKKNVGTDCGDLNIRKPTSKKYNLRSIAIDTSDLGVTKEVDDNDCEFFWNCNDEPRTYSKKKKDDGIKEELNSDIDDKLSEINEEVVEDKYDVKEETDEESDLDLVTAAKVAKCKEVASAKNIKLNEVNGNERILFECEICKVSFDKKYLGFLHLGNHVENDEFKCMNCEEKFATVDSLMKHNEDHKTGRVVSTVGTEKNIKCSICDKKFSSKSKMLSHKRFHKEKDKNFHCDLCNENESPHTFTSYKALYVHKRLKHDEKKERKPRLKREFVCLFCGKEFKSNKALSDHAPVHTGEKNYLCDICNKSYTTSANLQIHKRTHTGQKNFKCTVCDKAFHKKDSLKVHFRKHSGERPFQCDLCPMKFDRNYILKNHRLRHFSEKTYICPVCGKAFTTHGGLNNHEKSHKKDPVVKKPRKPAVKPTLDTENAVICDVCGKVYSTRSNLRIHKFVHLGVKPFQCPVCHQSYAKKDSMLTHMRKHTDERPFACETCGMTFYRNHTLKTHRLRHTGERPHKCPLCGKCFTQSSSLTYHLKHHDRREEKKKMTGEDPKTPKKKRLNSPTTKKSKLKTDENKKLEIRTEIIIMDKEPEVKDNFPKGGHFMLPVDKEFLLLDKPLQNKDMEFYGEAPNPTPNKLSYYIAKSHVLSLPNKNKNYLSVIKNPDSEYENLIVSKNSFITKDGTITTNREKGKEENEGRLDVKPQNVLPVTGEILNAAAFISDENGELIPYTPMALQTINADNVMINPLIPLESEDLEKRKVLLRTPKLASKCNLKSEKGKGGSVGEGRNSQKIQVISSPGLTPIQIQVPCIDEGMLQIPGNYFNNVQSSQL